jgi:hypothetical protein
MYQFGPDETARQVVPRQWLEWIAQFPEAGEVLAAPGQSLEFTESRPLGAIWALDALWTRLGVGASMRRLLASHGLDESAERILFALVANRALAPSSVLTTARWASEDVFITDLPVTTENACQQAADWLPEIGDVLEREIFDRVGSMQNRDIDRVFFGVTAVWPDGRPDGELVVHGERTLGNSGNTDVDRRTAWLRGYGKHVDHGGYAPRAVIGMAVTQDGFPVRTWCWEGTTAEPTLIGEVKDDLRDWGPSRVIWVCGPGSASAQSRHHLRETGNCIIGEKLRPGSAEAAAALSAHGRYQDVAGDLRVKEVQLGDDGRFIICYEPGLAVRDAAIRARTLDRLNEFITYTDTLSKHERAEACGLIAARPGLNRYLRVTSGGRLRIHAKSVRAEENLDGKYLLYASAPELSAKDIALGYTRLLEMEHNLRAMNQLVEPRSAWPCGQDRIRAHVLLCWLALLLARVAENACRARWPALRHELDRIAIGTFTGPVGTFRQRTEITDTQRAIFAQLGIDPPPLMPRLPLAEIS